MNIDINVVCLTYPCTMHTKAPHFVLCTKHWGILKIRKFSYFRMISETVEVLH